VRVLGRTEELAAIDEFLAAVVADTGFAISLILGEPGIGKTVLWDAARTRARAMGCTVLTARPIEQEAGLDFAALCDLMADVPDAAIDKLPGPQRDALQVALLRADATGANPDPRSVATAAVGLLRGLSDEGPVLVAIDDLHWLDGDTGRVLGFALRRLGPERIGLLGTARTVRGEAGPLVTDDVEPDRVRRIVPGGLSLGATREMLLDRLDFAPPHRVLVQLHEAAAGNPYFAVELARTLGTDSRVDQLSVPASLRRLLRGRVAQIPSEVREVLLGAALTRADTLALVIAAAPAPAAALEHLETAADDGVIDLRDGRVAFTHPLLRSVVIEDAAPRQVRAAHARLAQHAASASQRARHLALAADGPDDIVAASLDEATREAHQRGASEAAAELAELAVAMTPHGDAAARRARLVTAAQFRFESGDPSRARTLIDDVAGADSPGPARAAALLRRATYERYCGEPVGHWTGTLEAALADAAGTRQLELAIHFALGFAAANTAGTVDAVRHIRAVVELADQVDDETLDAQVAAGVAWITFSTGGGVRTDLLDRALGTAQPPERVPAEMTPTFTAAMTLGYAGEITRACALLEDALADAAERGDESSIPSLAWPLARFLTWTGEWERAERWCADGARAAELSSNLFGTAAVAGVRGILRASQGRLDEARADAAVAVRLAERIGLVVPAQLAAEALALAELALADYAAVADVLGPLAEQVAASGAVEPRLLRHVPLQIEALVRQRELDSAEQLLTTFAGRAESAGPSWATAAAARCRALLLAARGDVNAADAALDDAIPATATLGMPFELARTQLIAGEIRRRSRQRRLATEALTDARDGFARLGAQVWAQRCEAELDRLAGRIGTSTDALTDAEQRVAQLAAEGHTTREIAATMFAGVRTVEAHLSSVYRKLGVRSRVELARRLSADGPT
jgi:DNA-binding CsgD family transcriptional regulator/tetratricopeptide (TPR) repeat protein